MSIVTLPYKNWATESQVWFILLQFTSVQFVGARQETNHCLVQNIHLFEYVPVVPMCVPPLWHIQP